MCIFFSINIYAFNKAITGKHTYFTSYLKFTDFHHSLSDNSVSHLLLCQRHIHRHCGHCLVLYLFSFFFFFTLCRPKSPWHDLCGWLGVKSQLSKYLVESSQWELFPIRSLSPRKASCNSQTTQPWDHGNCAYESSSLLLLLLINYKVHAGSLCVSIIHQTLTWTTGSLTCVRDHSYACGYTQRVGHNGSDSAQQFWLGKTHKMFWCSWRGSNLRSLDFESPVTPFYK